MCARVQTSAAAKLRARLHGAPIAIKRRPPRYFGAKADELDAREEHSQNRIGDAISGRRQRGAAIAERALQPFQNVDRLGAAKICKPPCCSGIENAEPIGEDAGARLIKSRKIGVLGGALEQAAMDPRQRFRDHDSRQPTTDEKRPEGQLFNGKGVMEVEPVFDLRAQRRLVDAKRIFGDVAALIENAVRQHKGRHRHVRIKPHIVRLRLAEPEMEVDEGALTGDAALGQGKARDR